MSPPPSPCAQWLRDFFDFFLDALLDFRADRGGFVFARAEPRGLLLLCVVDGREWVENRDARANVEDLDVWPRIGYRESYSPI